MAKKSKNPEPELWEKQVGESEQAYEAFELYRDSDKRRLISVAEELHKSYSLIRRWKDHWYWEARIAAYDNKLQKQKLAKRMKEREEMYDRHANLSVGLQSLVSEALKLQLKKPEELSARDIAYIMKVATDLDRISRNEQLALGSQFSEYTEGPIQAGVSDVVIYMPEIIPEESCEVDEDDE